jgi:hypothetical protein
LGRQGVVLAVSTDQQDPRHLIPELGERGETCPNREAALASSQPTDDWKKELTLGRFLAFIFAPLIVIGACVQMTETSPSAPAGIAAQTESDQTAALPALDEKMIALCRRIIDEATKMGVVRDKPSPNRINVEDARWAMLPADDKRSLLAAVGCAAFKLRQADWENVSNADGYTVAYGYRSGKRVAMATATGYNFE